MAQHPRFDAVCFDCDSTLTRIEGIDELARRAGREAEIASLTEAAINGAIPLEAVYAKRLDLVRPDRAALAWLAERYADEMVSGAAETVATLRRHGKAVYVVTSGLLQAVAEFAGVLGLAPAQVHAVEVHFDAAGAYQGFDSSSPLCCSGGKATVCRTIAATHGNVVMVGDGVTDLAARAGGAYVIGYGGITHRDVMLREADCYIAAPSLTAALAIVAISKDRARSPLRRGA
jgi:phosphoserine phosphatase